MADVPRPRRDDPRRSERLTARQGRSRVARHRLARAPALGRRSPAGRSTSSTSATGPPSCSSTACRAPGRTGWRTSPSSPRGHRVDRDRPARASAHSPMPAEKISIPGYGAVRRRAARRARASSAAAVVGNSMGGFIGAELAIQFPHARRAARARLGRGHLDRAPAQRARAGRAATATRDVLTPSAPAGSRARSDELARRPRRAAGDAAARRRAIPTGCPAPLVAEQIRGLGQARLPRRARRADRLPDPRPAARDRLPDAGRLGREGPPRAGARRRRLRRAIPDARKVVYEDTGHVAMLERPARFNACVDDFLAEEPGEQVGASDAGRHVAPRLAHPTAQRTAVDRRPRDGAGRPARRTWPARRCASGLAGAS